MKTFSILFLFFFFHSILTNQEFLLTSTNYFHHIHCHDNLYIKINSIKYFYNQSNCKIDLDKQICSNQSSCILNLKPFLFNHVRHHMTKCRTIKLKSIRLNYTCVNETFKSINIRNQPRINYTILLFLSIIIFVSLFALLCSYLRHFSMNEQRNSIVNDTCQKQEYEMKNFLMVESSSSSSTLTSLNNKNMITNSSEYDNLIKHPSQSLEHFSTLKVQLK